MKINCKDMACPQPVLELKKALEGLAEDGIIEVEVNSVSSIENCKRFASSKGCEVKSEVKGDGTVILTIVKGFGCAVTDETRGGFINKTFFVKSDGIGNGELGKKLLHGFLKTTLEADILPANIVFVNEGVLVTTQDENSETIETLKELSQRGVKVYSCGLCLGFLGIDANMLKVGEIGNAFDTVNMLLGSEVVSL
jgi:selenium metabolism protein YedF